MSNLGDIKETRKAKKFTGSEPFPTAGGGAGETYLNAYGLCPLDHGKAPTHPARAPVLELAYDSSLCQEETRGYEMKGLEGGTPRSRQNYS